MKCCWCHGEIEPIKKDGKVVWDQGHNAQPLMEGRCCDDCNTLVVVPTRVRRLLREAIDKN